jgi:hypothetical protein
MLADFVKSSLPHSLLLAGAIASVLTLSCSTNIFNPAGKKPFYEIDARGHLLEGRRYLREERPFDAYDEFDKALSMDKYLGAARFGLAKSAFRMFDLNPVRLLESLSGDSADSSAIRRLFSLSWTSVDSIYAPVHMADTTLKPMFLPGYASSDGFDPSWIAADFSLIAGMHALVGMLDFDNNGRLNEQDNPFRSVSIAWNGTSLEVTGVRELLQDSLFRAAMLAKIDSSVKDARLAVGVFAKTFADSAKYAGVDSLLELFSAKLEEFKNESE